MTNPKHFYVELSGNPHKDDKECYKRYCGAEPFKPTSPSEEVVRFVEYSAYEELKQAADALADYMDKSTCIGNCKLGDGKVSAICYKHKLVADFRNKFSGGAK